MRSYSRSARPERSLPAYTLTTRVVRRIRLLLAEHRRWSLSSPNSAIPARHLPILLAPITRQETTSLCQITITSSTSNSGHTSLAKNAETERKISLTHLSSATSRLSQLLATRALPIASIDLMLAAPLTQRLRRDPKTQSDMRDRRPLILMLRQRLLEHPKSTLPELKREFSGHSSSSQRNGTKPGANHPFHRGHLGRGRHRRFQSPQPTAYSVERRLSSDHRHDDDHALRRNPLLDPRHHRSRVRPLSQPSLAKPLLIGRRARGAHNDLLAALQWAAGEFGDRYVIRDAERLQDPWARPRRRGARGARGDRSWLSPRQPDHFGDPCNDTP